MRLQSYREYFQEQLKHGKIHEEMSQEHVIGYIKEKHDKDYILNSVRDDAKFDFDLVEVGTEKMISFEVKADIRSKTTNNFYIEYQNGFGKPTGIKLTTADYHIITDEIEFYLIPTEKLKEIIVMRDWKKVTTKKIFWDPFNDEVENRITSWGHLVDRNVIIAKANKIY